MGRERKGCDASGGSIRVNGAQVIVLVSREEFLILVRHVVELKTRLEDALTLFLRVTNTSRVGGEVC